LLCNYVTKAASGQNAGLLLDGSDRIDEDLGHLDKHIKVLENAPSVRNRQSLFTRGTDGFTRGELSGRVDKHAVGSSPYAMETGPLSENREDLGKKVQRLSTQVQKIISEAHKSSISFGSLGLKPVQEVDSWLAANPLAAKHYGLCPDLMIFLE
jgi:hypothetical protein